jgi:hypothetical protein
LAPNFPFSFPLFIILLILKDFVWIV